MKLYYYNQRNYGDWDKDNLRYNKPDGEHKTIASSGCGVVSACIAFNTLAGKELYSVKQMRDFAVKCGARVESGTDENTLLSALCKKNKDFSYKTTRDVNALVKHLKNGGVAICNQGDKYNVFANSGHYVVAYRMIAGNIEVADPYMYSGKYDSRKNKIVAKTDTGCIVTPTEMAKATDDRYPSYYLISYAKKAKKYFTPDATVKTECDVYCDNKLKVPTGHLLKGEKVKVRFKGKVLAIIQYNTYDGYGVGLVSLKKLKIGK